MDTANNHTKLEAALKKKAFLSFHNDGIIDILWGWNLAVIGVSLHLHKMSPLSAFIALTPLFFYTPMKYLITLPRLGHAQFRTQRTLSIWVVGVVGIIFLLAAVIMGFLIESPSGFVGPIALALLGIAFLMALFSGFNRILAYMILIPLYFIVGFGLRILSPPMIIATGLILIALGVWMLVKFLGAYPMQAEESELGEK